MWGSRCIWQMYKYIPDGKCPDTTLQVNFLLDFQTQLSGKHRGTSGVTIFYFCLFFIFLNELQVLTPSKKNGTASVFQPGLSSV